MRRSALCRSRREVSNAYLVAIIGFDTEENEPCKVCPLSAYISPRCHGAATRDKLLSIIEAGCGTLDSFNDLVRNIELTFFASTLEGVNTAEISET